MDTLPFLIDLHVHSSLYSDCATTLNPFEIETFALKAGIDAVVLTEHDSLWATDRFRDLQGQARDIEFFNGIEITAQHDYHLVALGISDTTLLPKGLPCQEIIDHVHNQDGIVILAHPYRNGLPPMKVMQQLDAIEVGSTSLHAPESKLSFILARELNKPAVACSDAHALIRIGWGYTSFPSRPTSVAHLCEMIKDGLGTPVLPNPFF